jgi:hypothetical protein
MPDHGRALPSYVTEYLESRDVDSSKLPENVLKTLAGLSTREVEFLAFIGAELKNGDVDNSIAVRIH